MFTAFYRVDTEETRSIEGTGLGLVIAKGIVEIHGGQMVMESKVGVGTSFKFDIHNLKDVSSDEESSPEAADSAAQAA
jgi:signal transduction histidine kinase